MTMRDEQLRDLSRDHHHALVLARRARRAASADAPVEPVWRAMVAAFERELAPHFAVEEEHLLPALAAHGEAALVARVLREHQLLRDLAQGPPGREELARFGALLRAHVPFEERELFVTAERVLDGEELARVGEAAARLPTAMARE